MTLNSTRALAIALTLFTTSLGFGSTEGAISGLITSSTGKAIANAQVELHSPEGTVNSTQSDADGKFQFFPVLVGDYDIQVSTKDNEPAHYEVHVSSGGNVQANVQLNAKADPAHPEMVMKVAAKKRLIHTASSTSMTEISKAEIKKLPQGTEISLPRLLSTTTPGVSQGTFGQMFFRGNHSNIQYQIDGVQLPDSPSNTFGQAFSPRNIDHMEVITGGIPAEYGQRLGAVVNIITQSGKIDPGGEVELNYGSYNTFSPHLIYGGSNETGNLKYYLSANYNQTSRALDTPQPKSYTNQSQGGAESIHNNGTGTSEFLRLDYQADNVNKYTFSAYYAQSSVQVPNYPSTFLPSDSYFGLNYQDSFGNQGENEEHDGHTHQFSLFNYTPSTTNNLHAETNFYSQVSWKHTFSEKSYFQLAPYYKYSLIVDQNDPSNDLYSSINGMTGANGTSFAQNRHTNNLGLKADYSIRPGDAHLVKTGFQLQGSRSDGWFSVQKDPNTSAYSNTDSNIGYFEGVYIQDDITLAQPLILNVGLRYDATQFSFANEQSNDGMLQPRVGLNYMASESTKLHAFYGKLFQPAPVENLRSTFSFFNEHATVSTYDIKAEKDDYFEVGVAHQLLEKQVVGLNVYYKEGVNILDAGRLLRTPIAQPFNFANGFGYGAEFSAKGQITADWSEFFNYSYTVAQGKNISGGMWANDHPVSSTYQTLDHVQTHTANAGVTYTQNNFWWTLQGLYGSGLRTGHDNSVNLPAHITVDTTLGYEFSKQSIFSRSKISFDVLNILDNAYPINIANAYNASAYSVGRQYFIRLTKYL